MSTPPTVRTPPMRGSASIHDAPEPEPEPEPEPSIYDAPSADATAATDGEVEVEGADLQLRGAGNERVNGFYGARGEANEKPQYVKLDDPEVWLYYGGWGEWYIKISGDVHYTDYCSMDRPRMDCWKVYMNHGMAPPPQLKWLGVTAVRPTALDLPEGAGDSKGLGSIKQVTRVVGGWGELA